MSQQLPFDVTEEYTFTVHYLDTDEKATYDDAADVKEALEQMSWDKHEWTPILQEEVEDGEFSLFVHSDTFEEDIFSQKGVTSWELRGYDIDPHSCFWEMFQDEFNVIVDTKLVQADEPIIEVQEYRVVTDSWYTELRYFNQHQQSEIEILLEAFGEYDSFLGGIRSFEFIKAMATVEVLEHSGIRYKQTVNMTYQELKDSEETSHAPRYDAHKVPDIRKIDLYTSSTVFSPQDILNIAYPAIGNLEYETMLIIILNSDNWVIGVRTLAFNPNSSVRINSHDILKNSLLSHASAIALVQNRPSENLLESIVDREDTVRLARASEIIGIPLIDHIIIGPEKGKFNSLKAKNVF